MFFRTEEPKTGLEILAETMYGCLAYPPRLISVMWRKTLILWRASVISLIHPRDTSNSPPIAIELP